MVLELVALVGFAEHVELVGSSLLDHLKLVQVNILQRSELVPLFPQVLHLHNTTNQYYMAFVS